MSAPSAVAAAGEQFDSISWAETSTGESLPAPMIVPGIGVVEALVLGLVEALGVGLVEAAPIGAVDAAALGCS